MKPKAYLANQLGFSELGRLTLKQIVLPALSDTGIQVIEPFEECSVVPLPICFDNNYAQYKLSFEQFGTSVGQTNNDAMQKSDLMIPILDGGHPVDDGVASEIGYFAAIHPKAPIFALRSDFRLAENISSKINCQILSYIRMGGGSLQNNLENWTAAIKWWVTHHYQA